MAKNKIPSFQKGKRKQKKYSGVSYAEVPADILALKPKVMEFFAQNINKNFLEFASKISGVNKTYNFYKLSNGVILAKLSTHYETEKTIIYDAIEINHATNDKKEAPKYLLKQNLLNNPYITENPIVKGIDYLKLEYQDRPELQKMMGVINVKGDKEQYYLAVMPHFAGENAEKLFLNEKINLKNTEKSDVKFASLNHKATENDIKSNSTLVEGAPLHQDFNNMTVSDGSIEYLQDTSEEEKNREDLSENLSKELEEINLLDNQGFKDYKEAVYNAIVNATLQDQENVIKYFLKLLTEAQNSLKVQEKKKPLIFNWTPIIKNTRKDEIFTINNSPDEFLKKFMELLERSIGLCEKNSRAVQAGLIQRDLKLANENIVGTEVFTYDFDETLSLLNKSIVDFKNETAPHGTFEYLSPYNRAVYIFIHRNLNTIHKARKTLAIFEVLNRLKPEFKNQLIKKANLTSDKPKGLENIQLISTMPSYVFNAKSDANSMGIILEQLSILSFKFLQYKEKDGKGLALSLFPKNPKDEPYVALLNHFLLITKKLLNPNLDDTYISTNALHDLQELKKLALSFDSGVHDVKKDDDAKSFNDNVNIQRKRQRSAPSLMFHKNKKIVSNSDLPYDVQTTAAILNSFDVLADTVVNKPIYKQDIPFVSRLPAGTSITVGLKIIKLDEDIYKLPNGLVLSEDPRVYGEGAFSKVKVWTDIKTGEKYAAKVLKNSLSMSKENELPYEEKEIIKNAKKEVFIFNKFYDKAFEGRYRGKAQVLKLQESETDKLIVLMPFLLPKVVYSKKHPVNKKNNNKEEEKREKEKKESENNSLFYTEDDAEDGDDVPLKFMDYYNQELDFFKKDELEKEERKRALFHLGEMNFNGDLIPQTIDEYKAEYLGQARIEQFTYEQLMKELNDNFDRFVSNKFDSSETLVYQPKKSEIISVPLSENFEEKLENILELSKNTALVVQHCFDEHIIFTDLKLDNLLINNDKTIMPIDFGGSEYVEDKLEFSDNELGLKGTLEYSTPNNLKALAYNVSNYPHAVKARKMLAILEILEARQKVDNNIKIPPKFSTEFKKQLIDTSFIPQYKYDETSMVYAFGCAIETYCIQNLKEIENDYVIRGGGLPKNYQNNNNDPRITALNQLLKISKRLKDTNSNYSASEAAKDIEKLQYRVKLSKKIAEKLKNPTDRRMTLLEQVLIPKTIIKNRAKYNLDRLTWNNTAQSLVIELDNEKYEVLPQRDHSIKIQDNSANKIVAILQIVDDKDSTGRNVESKLISNDERVIAANLRAIFATAEVGAPITLENYQEYPESALLVQKVAEDLKENEGLDIKIAFDEKTKDAVELYKKTPEYLHKPGTS